MRWSWPRLRIGVLKEKFNEIKIRIKIEIGIRIARRAKKWQAFANGGQVVRLRLGMFDPTR